MPHAGAAVAGGQAGHVLHAVLEQERHAGERPGRQRRRELRARLGLHQPADGVDARLRAPQLAQRELQQLVRAGAHGGRAQQAADGFFLLAHARQNFPRSRPTVSRSFFLLGAPSGVK